MDLGPVPLRKDDFLCQNWGISVPGVEDEELDLVNLSLMSAKSYPGYLEIRFRVWSDRPSGAAELRRLLLRPCIVIDQYKTLWTIENLKPSKQTKIDFDRVEVGPIDLDMASDAPCTESLFLINPMYTVIHDVQ